MEFIERSCREFVSLLAGKSPVPGGGGAAALAGAVGTALGNMVGSLTLGKPKYADVQAGIAVLKARADVLQDGLLALVQRDAEVFEPLSRAYGLPTDTPARLAEKQRVTERALADAARVPLEIMERCGEAILLQKEFAAQGASIAISDVGVGVALCKAALQGASLNVFINTKAMRNRRYAEELNNRTGRLLAEYLPLADAVYADVLARLK
jgi:formiminotetrahydrofolate cyclodeaminase